MQGDVTSVKFNVIMAVETLYTDTFRVANMLFESIVTG